MNYNFIIAEMISRQWGMTSEAMAGMLKALKGTLSQDDRELFHGADVGDFEAITQNMGNPPQDDPDNQYLLIDGNIGTILIDGPIVPRSSRSWKVSGINSIQQISKNFQALENDPKIEKIVLFMDTPGGDVRGVSDFASQIKNCSKPVIAYVFGMAASAGYWICSQADKIYCADTAMVGSIGVVQSYYKNEDDSIDIVSSRAPKKRMDPDTETGKKEVVKILDDIETVFINTVAEGRKVSIDTVASDFGQGGMLVAARAQDAKMIDGIFTLGEFLNEIKDNSPAQTAGSHERTVNMNLQEAIAQNPAIQVEVDKLVNAGKADVEKAVAARTEAAAPFLANEKYGKPVAELAAKVIAGTASADALTTVVTVIDAQEEKEKSDSAKEENAELPETPAQSPDANSEGKEVLADIAAMREIMGGA